MLVKIISIMLKNTYTTDDLVERIGLMRKYYNVRLFKDGADALLKDVVQNDCDASTLKAIEDWVLAFDKEGIQPLLVYEALDTVQEDLEGVPAITLYVPVRFTPEQIKGLGVWFRENIQPNILLSLHIDPRTTGGCSFIWKDIYHDFSLRYFINKEQKEINSMFNKYTHVE